MEYFNEKDLQPQKYKATSFSLLVLALALILSAFLTFQDDFTLQIVSLVLGVICVFFGLRILLKLRSRK